MAWQKASPALMDLLAAALANFACEPRQMFGSTAYFVHGQMFTAVHQDHIMLRLGDSDRQQILAAYQDAAPFEPMPGRVMREYVTLPHAVIEDGALLASWLQRSYDYVASLPPKEHKASRRNR